MLHRALNDVQFSIRQLHMLDILCNGMGRDLLWMRSNLGGHLTPFLCQAYIEWYSYITACTAAPTEAWGSHMDGPLLYHFQQLVVILHHDIPAIDIGMELLQTKAYQQTL